MFKPITELVRRYQCGMCTEVIEAKAADGWLFIWVTYRQPWLRPGESSYRDCYATPLEEKKMDYALYTTSEINYLASIGWRGILLVEDMILPGEEEGNLWLGHYRGGWFFSSVIW